MRRWARYGHERLYGQPGGTALGYLDLKTGRYHSDGITNLLLQQKAITDHLAAQHLAGDPAPVRLCHPQAVGPTSEVAHAAATEPESPSKGHPWRTAAVVSASPTLPAEPLSTPAWNDLAEAKAGAAARERAARQLGGQRDDASASAREG